MDSLENSLEVSLGGFLHGSLDLLVRSGLLNSSSQVDDGDVGAARAKTISLRKCEISEMRENLRGDSESHSSELAVESGDDLTDSLGGSGSGRNDVGGSTSSSSPVLGGRPVDGLLGSGGGVDAAGGGRYD